MNRERLESCLPDTGQELLLRSALLNGREATSAWDEWKSIVSIDQIDSGSYRLLPLVYANLKSDISADPLMKRIAGVTRHTWSKNQLLMQSLAEIVRSFHQAAIPVMLLKGSALLLRYYKNYGLRPMNDADLMVPVDRAADAIRLLQKRGYSPRVSSVSFSERHISLIHAYNFTNSEHRGMDLHWHLLDECRQPGADDDFWSGASALEFAGVPCRALNDSDQLFHTLVHGMRWDPVPPVRWIADAIMILRSSNNLDWNRFIRQCKDRRLTLPAVDALQYLREIFEASIPSQVFVELQNTPVSRIQRLEYRYKLQDHSKRIWGRLPLSWFSYYRSVDGRAWYKKAIGFADYLKDFWGANSVWHVPALAFTRILRKMGLGLHG